MPTFCRHNRFFADCPICSKGTVLDSSAPPSRSRSSRSSGSTRATSTRAGTPRAFRGPYGSAGPYHDDEGAYEIRLEKVPGGLRLGDWGGGAIRKRAPVLASADVAALVLGAAERGALAERDAGPLRDALAAEPVEGADANGAVVASKGRAGDLRDELRVERLEDGRLRIARWVNRPGRGWELQEAPVMLPAQRYAEALAKAARSGFLG